MNTRTHHKELERLARKRAGAKLGWYIHASVYIAVNLLLAALSAASGRHWRRSMRVHRPNYTVFACACWAASRMPRTRSTMPI